MSRVLFCFLFMVNEVRLGWPWRLGGEGAPWDFSLTSFASILEGWRSEVSIPGMSVWQEKRYQD